MGAAGVLGAVVTPSSTIPLCAEPGAGAPLALVECRSTRARALHCIRVCGCRRASGQGHSPRRLRAAHVTALAKPGRSVCGWLQWLFGRAGPCCSACASVLP